MNIKCYLNLVIISMLFVISGCATIKPDPDRAGCYSIDGKAKYGYIQGVSGSAKGVLVYIGSNLKGKVKIKCNRIIQEITFDRPLTVELPEWVEDVPISTN